MYYAGDKCVLAQAITSKQYSKHVPNFPYESSRARSVPVSPHVLWIFASVLMCASTHLCVHKTKGNHYQQSTCKNNMFSWKHKLINLLEYCIHENKGEFDSLCSCDILTNRYLIAFCNESQTQSCSRAASTMTV